MFASATYQNDYFGKSQLVYEPDDLNENHKALILWGGEDIATELYKEKAVYSHGGTYMSDRDVMESLLIDKAVSLGIPILGICRGAQLLCAKAGGKLWQHVDNHAGKDHHVEVRINGVRTLGYTNSYHHQMMRPPEDAEVLGTAPVLSLRKCSEVEHTNVDPEPEIVWFPKLNALGVQGHPEWLLQQSFLSRVTRELFKEKTNVALHNWG